MQKAYNRTYWENYPSDKTAVNQDNLNKIEVGLDEIDDRVIILDTTKATKVEVSHLFADVAFDEGTGVITFTRKNGAVVSIDTKLEKLAVNFAYDPVTEQIVITLDDGTKQYVDLSALITQYEFMDSDTIGFQVQADGSVKAAVLDGSITEDKLQPDYLADIRVEAAKAEASATAAATSETNAKASETAAKESQTAAKASETNAKTYATNAKTSETNAESSASTASKKASESANSAKAAAMSETNASSSASTASSKATAAANSANSAATSATTATNKANAAAASASDASDSATEAESYALGGTGTRENEDSDNAKYYYEQAKHISQGGNGLVPMGTIAFEQLPTADITVNAMYNISNAFTSDDRFLDGGGVYYGAGSNVYYTVDGEWDVLAASTVTGVKGNAETSYRQGNVNLTPANIGALGADKNAVSATKWNTARKINGMSVNGTADRANYGTCSTAADTAAKVVACTGFALVTGAEITVKFTVTNTAANPTLNVNSTGAKAIYYRGAAISAGYLAANRTYTFRYNGAQYELVGDINTLVNGNTANSTVSFTSKDDAEPTGWEEIALLSSGETHASLFQKISKMFKNLRWLYKMLGSTDISAIGDGTVTGALSVVNSKLSDMFITKEWKTKVTLPALKPQEISVAEFGASTPSGYTPVAIGYFGIDNSLCYTYAVGRQGVMYVKNMHTEPLTVNATIRILYVKSNLMSTLGN